MRSAGKGMGGRGGGKADRVEPMLNGESFGLIQRFARHGGDMGLPAVSADIIDQISNSIGCGPLQRRRCSFTARRLVHSRGVCGQIFNLCVGDEQQAAQPTGIKRRGSFAQDRQFRSQVVTIKRNFTNKPPTARRTVEQTNAVERQGEGKIRLHRRRL